MEEPLRTQILVENVKMETLLMLPKLFANLIEEMGRNMIQRNEKMEEFQMVMVETQTVRLKMDGSE